MSSTIYDLGRGARCEDFISFVRRSEKDITLRDLICNTLESFREVVTLGDMAIAIEELVKVIHLIQGSYITSHYDGLIAEILGSDPSEEVCRCNPNAIFDIYSDVISSPRRQIARN